MDGVNDFNQSWSRLTRGLVALAFIGLAWIAGIILYRLTWHPLAKYPGPLLGRITSLYGFWHTKRGNVHIDMLHCHETYGPIVRYQPNRLLLNSHAALKDIYGYGAPTSKAAVYHQFPTGYAYSTHNMVDKARHKLKRKLVQQAFSPNAMEIWHSALRRQLDVMCDALSRNVVPGQGIEPKDPEGWGSPQMVSQWCLCLLTDVVMDGVFSKTLQTLTSTNNWYMLDLVHQTYDWLGLIFQCPKLSAWGLDKYLLPRLCHARAKLRIIFGNILAQRIESRATKGDVYDVFLNAKDPETDEGWPVSELGAEALLLFGAGPDATSSSMSAALFYITNHRHAYERVVAEVRRAFVCVNDIKPGDALNRCYFLQACVQEAQRRNPANGSALWRVMDITAKCGDEVIPAGVDVGVAIYAIHHNPTYFPEPFEFKPERWMLSSDNPQSAIDRARSAWNPFSLGPRGCIGRPVAHLQLMVTLARLYWQFDVRWTQDARLASIGCGSKDAEYGRHRPDEFQTHCSFQNSVRGPMLEFRDRLVA